MLLAIAFHAANGEVPADENDARLYRIPRAGILVTAAEPNLGSGPDWMFFLERADDRTRTQIQLVWAGRVHDTDENRAESHRGDLPDQPRLPAGRVGALRCGVRSVLRRN